MKKQKKVVLARATKKQLRALIRQLKRGVRDGVIALAAERVRGAEAVAAERRLRHQEAAEVRNRARACSEYVESELSTYATGRDENLLRAAFEYIPYGSKGENAAGFGVHPFTRWGLETPEMRRFRLEKEEEEREARYERNAEAREQYVGEDLGYLESRFLRTR